MSDVSKKRLLLRQQEEIHTQELEEAYSRLAGSNDFGVFYAAMQEKMQAARSSLPVIIVTEQDKADYNRLVGFIEGLEVMFATVRRYMKQGKDL